MVPKLYGRMTYDPCSCNHLTRHLFQHHFDHHHEGHQCEVDMTSKETDCDVTKENGMTTLVTVRTREMSKR